METKVKLNKDTLEVKANKGFSVGNGAAGGYTFISEAEYWLIALEDKVVLRSLFNDVEYNTDIEEIDSLKHTFKINGKEYKYQVVE